MRVPRFLVQREPAYLGWWNSLRALCGRANRPRSNGFNYIFRSASVARFELAGPSLGASFLLHCFLILLLSYLPHALAAKALALEAPSRSEKIYYRVPLLDPYKMPPRIAPAGPGGRPGSGSLPDRLPALGSTASLGNLTVVSKPLHPDNSRQTIIQPSSPPDLRITTELKLPNIVLGIPSDVPKAPIRFNPTDARPTLASQPIKVEEAPAPVPANPTSPLVTLLEPSNSQPRLPIPAAAAAPVRKPGFSGATAASDGDAGVPAGGSGLVVMGVDPSAATSELWLPGGNRWGEFSISPNGGQPGSPGGSSNGVVGGGNGGGGTGGDGTAGIGSGGSGGGGNSGLPGTLSVNGTGTITGSNTGWVGAGTLGPELANSMVFPVLSPMHARKNAFVVSAGPTGGGGLNIYGALHCGKIYTIFLPMPEKSWTLQYCVPSGSMEKPMTGTRSTAVHLDQGLVPPDVESRFDFRRMPVPPEKARKMIVLKGIIREDGTVENLQVFQSILPEMDAAARLAFSRWKFKPAMRADKPVTVEILVGIPALPAGGQESR